MTQTVNPLRAYFRQPAIYIRLPSGGLYWPDGSIDIPANGELPVYPMTAVDEIIYRTPDALYNGQATVDVIQSCVPNIRDAWQMPGIDVNSILISIRIASYGHEMEVSSTCSKCGTESDYTIDMRTVLDQIERPDYSKTLPAGDLEIFFRPMSFQEQNRINIQQFETQKTISLITQSDDTEENKLARMNDLMKKVTAVTAQALTYNVAGVRSPAGFVSETEFISEFISNCDRTVFNAIRDYAMDLRLSSDPKPAQLKCTNCQHQYKQAISLDMSTFFGTAS